VSDADDATRAALERIALDGSDLNRPLDMDFFVAVPDAAAGAVVAARAVSLGFATNVEQDVESGEWTCYCTLRLVPAFDAVVAIEEQLDALAHDVGGHADGFGTFGNADPTHA
jgi:hypothetical protein